MDKYLNIKQLLGISEIDRVNTLLSHELHHFNNNIFIKEKSYYIYLSNTPFNLILNAVDNVICFYYKYFKGEYPSDAIKIN